MWPDSDYRFFLKRFYLKLLPSLMKPLISPLAAAPAEHPSPSPAGAAGGEWQPPAGLWPVMLTPFQADGSIDWTALDPLVEWYVEAGASGLFALCLSSEMYLLSEEERLALARRIIARVGGRIPVVAGGTFGAGVEPIADFARRLADTGVAAVICLTNQFCPAGASAERWQEGVERFLALTDPAMPLGLYECPQPHRRLLTPAQTVWTARTGRFRFLKDTSCQLGFIRPRIAAFRGTGMRLFNANTPTLLASLRAGADGYSGIAANYAPRLYAWLCARFAAEPAVAERLHRFLCVADPLIGARYPAAAKIFLASCGLKISPKCRIADPVFAEEDLLMLAALRDEVLAWQRELGLARISGA